MYSLTCIAASRFSKQSVNTRILHNPTIFWINTETHRPSALNFLEASILLTSRNFLVRLWASGMFEVLMLAECQTGTCNGIILWFWGFFFTCVTPTQAVWVLWQLLQSVSCFTCLPKFTKNVAFSSAITFDFDHKFAFEGRSCFC